MATKAVTEQKPQKKTNIEKKMNASFVTYLHKVLKNVSEAHIGVKTAEQLSSLIKVIVLQLSAEARSLCVHSKRCTVGERDIMTAVNVWIPKDMSADVQVSIREALEFYQKYQEEHSQTETAGEKTRASPVRMETQAGLLFSVSVVETILRDYGMSNLNVAKKAKIALAAVAEYIAATILDKTSDYVKDQKKKIIYIRYLFMTINNDEDLTNLCQNFNIELVGGGVVPGYHPELNKQKTQKPKTRGAKCRPGDKSLTNIKELQQTCDLLVQKDPFEKEVRAVVTNIISETRTLDILRVKANSDKKPVVRFSYGSILALQYFAEQRVTSLLSQAVRVGIYAGHEGVKGDDVNMVWDLAYPNVHRVVGDKGPLSLNKLSKNGIERMATRGGVKRKRDDMYIAVRQFMYSLLHNVLFSALQYINHRDYVTISLGDLERSISNLGIRFTIPPTMGKPKNVRKKATSAPASPAPTPRKTTKAAPKAAAKGVSKKGRKKGASRRRSAIKSS